MKKRTGEKKNIENKFLGHGQNSVYEPDNVDMNFNIEDRYIENDENIVEGDFHQRHPNRTIGKRRSEEKKLKEDF